MKDGTVTLKTNIAVPHTIKHEDTAWPSKSRSCLTSQNMKICVYTKMYMPIIPNFQICTAIIQDIIAQNWKQPKYPSIGK